MAIIVAVEDSVPSAPLPDTPCPLRHELPCGCDNGGCRGEDLCDVRDGRIGRFGGQPARVDKVRPQWSLGGRCNGVVLVRKLRDRSPTLLLRDNRLMRRQFAADVPQYRVHDGTATEVSTLARAYARGCSTAGPDTDTQFHMCAPMCALGREGSPISQ